MTSRSTTVLVGIALLFAWLVIPFAKAQPLSTPVKAVQLTGLAGVKDNARGTLRVENGQLQFLGLDSEYHDVKRAEGVLLLADIKRKSQPLSKNGSASLWDIGDGVVCLEFHSKANSLDPDIIGMIAKALALIGDGKGDWKALVIGNDADNFSVGANLGLVIFAINIALYDQLTANAATAPKSAAPAATTTSTPLPARKPAAPAAPAPAPAAK